jgi:hypothetical protein
MVNLEELSHRQGLEPLEELLTLVVRPQGELASVSRASSPEMRVIIFPGPPLPVHWGARFGCDHRACFRDANLPGRRWFKQGLVPRKRSRRS